MSKKLRALAPSRESSTQFASKSSTTSAPPWESPEWQEAVQQTPGLKPFFDNLESFVELPKGVKKLRSLFIGLGVSGKLIPQVADDQPASEVVVKCEQLRKSLAADGKLSNKKRLPEVELSEQEYAAPLGWEWVRINHICDHRLGKMLDKAKNKGTPYSYLRNTNVQWHEFDLADVKEMRFEEDELDVFEVRSGDLMVCEGGYPGRCAIWSGEVSQMMFQKAIHRVRPLGGIKSKFILLRLWCDSQRGHLDQHFTGATIKHFTGKELARYAICLPPLAEQRRIVSKVEGLMSLCDKLEDYRKQRESVRERASRSVLASLTSVLASLTSAPRVGVQPIGAGEHESVKGSAKACTPAPLKLKRETLKNAWHRLSDHFEVLLDQPETVPHLRQSILQLAVQGKLIPQDPRDEPGTIDVLGNLLRENSLNGYSKKPSDVPEGVQVLRISAGTARSDFYVEETDHKWSVVSDKERDKFNLQKNDLLACRFNGNLRYVGKFSLYRNELGTAQIYPDKLIRFRVDLEKLDPRFAVYALNARDSRKKIESFCATTAGNIGISATNLKTIGLHVPPLAEQKRIVSKVSILLSQCDELSARLRSRQSTTDDLLTALIHRILESS